MRGKSATPSTRTWSFLVDPWVRCLVRSLPGLAVLATPPSSALSLGIESVISFLGQPLRVEIPINAVAGENWDLSCFALVPSIRRDGAPTLRQGRIELSGDGKRLILRSVGPVEEPAIRFAVDVGCSVPLRREFTVLLDPAPVSSAVTNVTPPMVESPPVSPPTAAQTTNERSAVVSSSAEGSSGSERRVPAMSARVTKPRPAASRNMSTPNRNDTNASARRAPRLVVKGADAVIDDAALAALAVPRLRIASELGTFPVADAGEPNAKGAVSAPLDELSAAIAKERRARLLAAPIDEDLPARLEADLVVAKRRLAELQAQISASIPESNASTAAISGDSRSRDSVSKTAAIKKSSGTADTGFEWRKWVWVPGVAIVAGLFAFLWHQHRRRQIAAASSWTAVNSVTVVHGEPTAVNATDHARPQPPTEPDVSMGPVTVSPTTVSPATVGAARVSSAVAEARDRLESPSFNLSQSAASLDVSELSQITDEAQVYAELGRTSEAIDILTDHIDRYEGDRPSPAAWLMLFELFRKTNRRSDYDRFAPLFRQRFNGRLPDWDEYSAELALDDGLESFPHLVARIERDWGTPSVRALLDELLYDNRGGSRLGFSLTAYKDLLLLLQVHDQLAADGRLGPAHTHESTGANDEDGTPKWDLALEPLDDQALPNEPGLDDFLKPKK